MEETKNSKLLESTDKKRVGNIGRFVMIIGGLLAFFPLLRLLRKRRMCLSFGRLDVCVGSGINIPLIISSLFFILFGYFLLKRKKFAAKLTLIISLGIIILVILIVFLGIISGP